MPAIVARSVIASRNSDPPSENLKYSPAGIDVFRVLHLPAVIQQIFNYYIQITSFLCYRLISEHFGVNRMTLLPTIAKLWCIKIKLFLDYSTVVPPPEYVTNLLTPASDITSWSSLIVQKLQFSRTKSRRKIGERALFVVVVDVG